MRMLAAAVIFGVLSGAAAQDARTPSKELEQLLDAEALDVERFEALATAVDFPIDALTELLEATPKSDDGQRRRGRLLRAFRIAGPRAAPAVDAIMALWRSNAVRDATELSETTAVLVVHAADPEAVAQAAGELLPQVLSGNPKDNHRAMLGVLRTIARARVGALTFDRAVELLQGNDALVSEFAAESLAAHGLPAAAHLREVARSKRERRIAVRTRTMTAEFASAEFRDLAVDAAARALAEVDADAVEAIAGLAALLQADLPSARRRAAMALGRHGADAAGAVQQLLAATNDRDDPALVAEAVTALGMVGVRDPAVLERLDALAGGPGRAIAARARAARRALEPR